MEIFWGSPQKKQTNEPAKQAGQKMADRKSLPTLILLFVNWI